MSLKCGIVGLPNVGKSTLFNALTVSKKAIAENFPFCTIEPNVGIVPVPDERLKKISKLSESLKTINTTVTFVDIAGLVKGASKGDGLGNKFLSHVREVDAIIHLVRCFESDNIQSVNKNVDPIRDIEIINTEILLADIEVIEKKLQKNKKKILDNKEILMLEDILKIFNKNDNIQQILDKYDNEILKNTGLISLKPQIIVCNVDEKSLINGNKYTKECQKKYGESVMIICAEIEDQIMNLNENERDNFIKESSIDQISIKKLIRTAYEELKLRTFFTSGTKETKAWTIKKNSTAIKAAGVIHSDFEKGFIRAETISYEDFIMYKGFSGCKTAGKLRLEGKDYIVNDGDVLFFRVSN